MPARPAASASRLLAIQDRFKSFALRPGVDLVMEATDFDAKLARADLVITGEGRIDAQTAFGKTALGVAKRAQAAGVRCIAVGGGVEPEGIEALAAVGCDRRARLGPAAPRRGGDGRGRRPGRALRRAPRPAGRRGGPGMTPAPTPAPKPKPRPRPKKRKFSDPARTYAKRLERYRPGLVPFVLDALAERYGREPWARRLDPTSELILTILTQNSADTNAEVAFQLLREAYPSGLEPQVHVPGIGWGGVGLPDRARRRTGPRSSSRRSPS